jgi:hypothetical protein
VIRFIPGLDEYNDPVKGYYARITYKVNDGNLDSLTNKTITIYVTPVNDIPRPIIEAEFTVPEVGDNGVVGAIHVLTPEETPISFNIRGYDPDGDPFDMILKNCYPEGGDVYLTSNVTTPQRLDCTYINVFSQNLGRGNVFESSNLNSIPFNSIRVHSPLYLISLFPIFIYQYYQSLFFLICITSFSIECVCMCACEKLIYVEMRDKLY